MNTQSWMYPQGRTISEAVKAGDYYRLVRANGAVAYDSPGAGSPEEALRGARIFELVHPGEILTIERHLPGSTIGCAVVETVGTIQA
jgi:hypothetical protein